MKGVIVLCVLVIILLSTVCFLNVNEGISNDKGTAYGGTYKTINTSADWDKHKPPNCPTYGNSYGCGLSKIIFINNPSQSTNALISLGYPSTSTKLHASHGIYYLANDSSSIRNHIRANWATPPKKPSLGVVYGPNG
jgi:hypothetical protein